MPLSITFTNLPCGDHHMAEPLESVVRKLSGTWHIAKDADNCGKNLRWFDAAPRDVFPAPVPGTIQQVFPQFHGVAWYYHAFAGPAAALKPSQRALLRFGAVDYLAEVWVNGMFAGSHENSETPFELDITQSIQSGKNLLAVRVLNPWRNAIDGFVLSELPRRNKTDWDQMNPGSGPNYGGIIFPVELIIAPAVRVLDIFAQPRVKDGRVKIAITVRNDLAEAVDVQIDADVCADEDGQILDRDQHSHRAMPGDSTFEITLTVAQHRLWALDDPYLYRVTVHSQAAYVGSTMQHQSMARFGFRDFRVIDGFFHLNGKRIFLKSTHTGNHFPIAVGVPLDPDLLRRDLIMAKAAGYNMVRFIAGMPFPRQLDFCDELGLMVQEEHLGGWLLADSPHAEQRYKRATREMILRDRHHPCITIWGLLNETPINNAFRAAVAALPMVRELDPTRLVLLGSGRWDGLLNIGSISNPGSSEWEHQWGAEDPNHETTFVFSPNVFCWEVIPAYVPGAGDAHLYPPLPLSKQDEHVVRTVGQGTKPVFISEYGVGSLGNPIEELRGYDVFKDFNKDISDYAILRKLAERAEAALTQMGMNDVYPFPEDLLRDSNRNMIQQRRRTFDMIRANPQCCGYNLTGMLDHAYTGEGLWTLWRRWKHGAAEMLQDGWASLRWCLFTDPVHGFAGAPITFEAVLANEGVLSPGQYPAKLRLWHEDGIAWEQKAQVTIPQNPPLAVAVFKQTLDMNLPAGKYTFAVQLEKGGIATSDRLEFFLSDAPKASGTVMTTGLDPATQTWLTKSGLTCKPFASSAQKGDVVLVGIPQGALEQTYGSLKAAAENGATVIFLSPGPFMVKPFASRENFQPPSVLPLGEDVTAREFHDWLYHKEIIAKRGPVFNGLPTGLLQWDYYGHVLGHALFDCRKFPDQVLAGALAVGHETWGGTDSGVIVGVYNQGRGRIIINSFQLLDRLTIDPAAARLLINLIQFAQTR